jgi:MFS family permease
MDTTTAVPQPDAARPGLLINRNFALLWAGQSVSALGDILFDTTLILWIATHIAHGRDWAPLAVSGVLFATALPTVVVSPLAGVFADRWESRRTMLLMNALRVGLLALLLPVAAGLVTSPAGGSLSVFWQLGEIYVVVVLATICA